MNEIICSCGEEVYLIDPLDNLCTCGKCYNLFGQEVTPSNEWTSEEKQ